MHTVKQLNTLDRSLFLVCRPTEMALVRYENNRSYSDEKNYYTTVDIFIITDCRLRQIKNEITSKFD